MVGMVFILFFHFSGGLRVIRSGSIDSSDVAGFCGRPNLHPIILCVHELVSRSSWPFVCWERKGIIKFGQMHTYDKMRNNT